MKDIHEAFTEWAVERGVQINGIAAHRFEGRGLGIIAEKKHPLCAHHTPCQRTFPGHFQRLQFTTHYAPWRAVLPSRDTFEDSMPLLWPASLQKLLPPQATKLLAKQQSKLKQDWTLSSAAFPAMTYEAYLHSWLLINTRTFYFVSPARKGKPKPPPAPKNRDDCMALNPFADYFNHTSSPSACLVGFCGDDYTVTTSTPIEKGDEVYISYGNHSNDFLLAEYGFILAGDTNQWDEVELDSYVLELLSADKQGILEEEGFLGNYVLDRETACYRTQVALRLACLPVGKWRRFVTGADDGAQDQAKVDEAFLKLLRKFQDDALEKLRLVGMLQDGTADQRDTMTNRWQQIGGLLQAAIDRVQS